MERETKLAFLAAYIHDMSRLHDGYCTIHGERASINKLPEFKELFQSIDVNLADLEEIKTAVCSHSLGEELPVNNPFYKTTALLKDADALDRIRLGRDNLDPHYLRFEQTKKMIPFARELFYSTENLKVRSFVEFLKIAETIENPF